MGDSFRRKGKWNEIPVTRLVRCYLLVLLKMWSRDHLHQNDY